MPARVGHARPVGTTWRMRIEWRGYEVDELGDPQLNDLVFEHPVELHRGFRCVGVEEPASDGGRWVVLLERMDWDEWCTAINSTDVRVWSFVRDRR